MSARAARLSAAFLLLLAERAPAPWVPLTQMRNWAQSTPTEVSDNSVRLETHRMHPGTGFDGSVIGNLDGVPRPKEHTAARNRAVVAPIGVGTPAQNLTCMLDASSADLWVPSYRCDTCSGDEQELKGFYKAQDSKTFMPLVVMTSFGPAPRALHIIYGAGAVSGFVVNDTVTFASATLKKQTFLLAEEASVAARRERAWDGVCGFGWGAPEHEGDPLYQSLKQAGKMMVYAFHATDPKDPQSRRLTVGALPTEPQNILWTDALKPWHHEHHKGMWVTSGRVALKGGLTDWDSPAQVAFETGTSYLLAPPMHYLAFMRNLLPNGDFDRLCGQDEGAGGVVICLCEARTKVSGQIMIGFKDQWGSDHQFPIPSEDLFEEVSPGRLCVPQVQARSMASDLRSPAGVLGPPYLDHPGAIQLPDSPFGPGGLPLGPGPVMGGGGPLKPFNPLAEIAKGFARGMEMHGKAPGIPLSSLLGGLMNLTKHTVIKEVVVETLGDGTRCETDVLRAANGTILNSTTEATPPGGKEHVVHGPMCSKTKKASQEIFNALPLPGAHPSLAGLRGNRRLQAVVPSDLWIIGDVFIKRYGAIFDFDESRIGFTRDGLGFSGFGSGSFGGGASIEAYKPSAGTDSIQTYESNPQTEGLAATAQTAASAPRADDAEAHLHAAAGHLVDSSNDAFAPAPAGSSLRRAVVLSGGVAVLALIATVGGLTSGRSQGRERPLLDTEADVADASVE
mmetsp:Transcript_45176/g.131437  ORF Transcript_45176/g.131437 Transcript_45176/m.131437 type:complete len:734 (-) Transcript_45176:290-2491(-)